MFIKSKVSLVSSEVTFLSEVGHAIDLKAEMTSRTQNLTAKQKSLKKSIPRSQGETKQKSVRRSKKIRSAIIAAWNC